MFAFHTLRHKSNQSTKEKSEHKDAKSKTHKRHAKFRDPDKKRNAKKKYRLPSKLWLKGVATLKQFCQAAQLAGVDKKGRARTDVGHAVVASFPNNIQAYLQALPIHERFDVMKKMDAFYRDGMDQLFPGCKRIDSRHTDKIRIHYESHIIKYDELGEKLYNSSKEKKSDSPGKTAIAANAAAWGKTANLGNSGKRWNTNASVLMTKSMRLLIQDKLRNMRKEELEAIKRRAGNWARRLEKDMSGLGRDRRKKKLLKLNLDTEIKKLDDLKSQSPAIKPTREQSPVRTIKPEQQHNVAKSPKTPNQGPSI